MIKFIWDEIIADGDYFHAAYVSQSEETEWKFHNHDYYEVFWVASGMGKHILRDQEQELKPSTYAFIRPQDAHNFRVLPSSEPFSFYNIAFSQESFENLNHLYQLSNIDLFNCHSPHPTPQILSGNIANKISKLFENLIFKPKTKIHLDAFLLSIATLSDPHEEASILQKAPSWLKNALHSFTKDTRDYHEFTASHLATFAGCTSAHLSRSMKTYLNITPTEWLLKHKLERSANLLQSTSYSITDIAFDSGFNNLSHFHRCFQKRYLSTPLHYRKKHQRSII